MKIFVLTSALTGGGAERVSALQANGLAELGHQVWLLSDLRRPVTYPINERVTLVDVGVEGNPLTLRWRAYCIMKRLIKAHCPDCVISNLTMNAMETKLAAWVLRKNVRIIVADHNSYERPAYARMPRRQWFQKFYLNQLYDHVTVLTEADVRFIGRRLKRVTVMPNPLCEPVRKAMPEKRRIVLGVGRLDAWHVKGFDLLIEAWNAVGRRHPDWTLRIVGNGSEENRRQLRAMSSVDNVEIADYTPDIVGHYRESAVFALSSRYEGFGLVLIEAMAQRCACVACDYRGRQSEIITDGVDGLLCPTDDAAALSNRIERLVDDNELRKQIQAHSADNLDRFSTTNYARRWERLIAEMCVREGDRRSEGTKQKDTQR